MEALRTAADLARAQGSELHVVHVLPLRASDPLSVNHPNPEHAFATQVDEVAAHLREVADPLLHGIETACLHVRLGEPDREIVQLATDIGADLIVVATQGRTGLDRLLLGSVAESVVRRAPCPVYTFRPKTVPAWDQIEPPCPDCIATQNQTGRSQLWCERHSTHRPRPHTYHQVPQGYGMGAQTFRGQS